MLQETIPLILYDKCCFSNLYAKINFKLMFREMLWVFLRK